MSFKSAQYVFLLADASNFKAAVSHAIIIVLTRKVLLEVLMLNSCQSSMIGYSISMWVYKD